MKQRALVLATTAANMDLTQVSRSLLRMGKSRYLYCLGVDLEWQYEPRRDTDGFSFSSVAATDSVIRSTVSKEYRDIVDEKLRLLDRGTLSLLHREVDVSDTFPESVPPRVGEQRGFPRLWTLKLLSLEPVTWLTLGSSQDNRSEALALVDWFDAWRDSEITDIPGPDYLRGYWTPYAVSRRICHLAKLGGILDGFDESVETVGRHLEQNVRFLHDHVEYDVGGNHIIENACSLIVGGAVMGDDEPIDRGLEILSSQLSVQFLDDGVHFQRSPMYHSILLYRVTWSIDLLRRVGYEVPSEVKRKVCPMYRALKALAPGQADYPLLNDAVYGECPTRSSCLELAEFILDCNSSGENLIQLTGDSGYYSISDGELTALLDGGIPCPAHLPGHAHNDIGNVVLWCGEEPVVTDTGAFDYQPGDRRAYARSIAAHNTIQADEVDQTMTRGRFKMGPRPEPRSEYVGDTQTAARVRFRSPRFVTDYEHTRTVEPTDDGILMIDKVEGVPETYTSRYHLAPEVSATVTGDTVALTLSNNLDLNVEITGVDDISLVESEYYPEYGVAENRSCIEGIIEDRGIRTIRTRFTRRN